MILTRTTSIVAFVAFVLAAACSSTEDRPAAGTGGGIPASGLPGSSGGAGDASADGGSNDATADADAGNLCAGITQEGDPADEIALSGSAPPPLGGVIADGTYILTELTAYGQQTSNDAGEGTTGLTGVVARATVVFAGGTLKKIEARGTKAVPPTSDAVTGASFVVNGTSLQTTSVCPTAGTTKSIPFSAVGGGVALFVDATHRELYTKK